MLQQKQSDLVAVVVANNTLVFGETQLAPLICCQSKRGQEAWSQRMDWSVVVGNYRKNGEINLNHVTRQEHQLLVLLYVNIKQRRRTHLEKTIQVFLMFSSCDELIENDLLLKSRG